MDEIKSNSTEESSSSNLDLEDGTLNNDEIESDDCLTKNGKEATLQANKLGADHNMTSGSAQDVMDMIQQISREGGGTLYLNGGTYTGSAHARVWNGWNYQDIQRSDGIVDISNVRVVGGSVDNPNQYATFQPNARDSTSLAFSGYSVWDGNGNRYYPDSGFNLTNVTFENLNCTGRFFSFNSGYLTDCVFNNLESYQHLFFVTGAYNDGGKPIVLTNCNFTNSKQTYRGDGPGDGTDGTSQFGVVFGAEMYGCNFINTSTATHGGAFCLSDEWISAACVPSKLVDCNFINITSRWFAVYIHGNYSNTTRFITEPQVVENCSFINCTATGEFGGALGISHNNVIINNTEFIHNTGGKGSAIMVGGINNTHDGFLGVNTQGNNITIYNCTFEDNIAKTDGQSSAHSTSPEFYTYPTGYGGAVYVYGNHTKIIDSTFNNNTADDSCGAAIYIRGDNTTVVNSEFYNHTSENGTIYLVGNDCKIKDSLFHDNDADSTGACIFIEGNRAEIGNTTFVNNTAPNGGCVFIIGDHTLIDNDTKFITNNATNGAGVYINGSNTMILNTSFIDNTAVNGAGAFIYGHDTDVNGSYFEGNNATNGGAVFIEGNINDISNSTFLRNNATNSWYIGNMTNGSSVSITIDTRAIRVAKNVTNVTLKDILPEEVEFVSANDTYSNETGIWYIGDMANGTSRTIVINTTAIRSKTNVTNVANVNCTEEEWNYSNNVDNATINIYPLINKTVSNSTPDYGDEVEYNLTVINTGDVMFNETVTLVDRLPEGVDFIKVLNEDGLKVISFDHSTKNLTWVVTNISANTKATITILANCTLVGLQENTWTIYGPEGMNRTVNATIVVGPKVDVSVEKTSDKINYFEGETVIWTITVHNANNGTNATNVTLKDILPEEVLYVSSNGTYNNNTGIWYIGNMTNGSSRTIVINTTAIKSKANVTNVANVSCNETEWNYTNNVDDAVINIYPLINKTVSNPTPDYHEEIEYKLTVENTGDVMFNETVTLVDRLPIGVDFIKVVNVTGLKVISFDNTTKNLTWNVTNITAHTKATITILAVCNAIGVQDNTWTIYGPEGMNRTVNATIEVKPIVDVSITKVADQEIYHIGDNVTWTITVHNAWNGTNATNVNVNDILPKEVEYLTHTVTQGQYNNNTGIWTIGFMANGTSQTLTIVSVAKINKTDITNVANVSCSEKEWNYSNNRDYATIEIVDTPINKTASKPVPDYHEEIEYYLTVTNLANETYNKTVTLVDSLPEGVTFLRVVNTSGLRVLSFNSTEKVQTWTVTDIEANTTAVITILARCDAVGIEINNWTIYYPNGDSKKVETPIDVQPIVDLSTTKTSNKDVYFLDDTAVWTITVHNAWNGTNATNVVIDELFPSEFEIINYTTTKGRYDPSARAWTIDFMEKGTTETLVITSVATVVTPFVDNPVNVTSNERDWNLSNNPSNKSVKVIDIPDPEKTVNNATPYYNDTVVYSLTIKNTGDIKYTNKLTVIDSMPQGLEYVKTVGISGAKLIKEVVKGQVITWTITNISAHSNAVIKVRFRAKALGNLTNNLTIVTPHANKTVNCTITPVPIADLAVTKTNDHYGKDCLNSTFVYWTIKVVNYGPNTAVNAIAKDILPEGIIYLSDDSDGAYDYETGIWTIGNLAKGKSVTMTIETIVDAIDTRINNKVVVSSDTYDPDKSNNRDNSSIKVISIADLKLTKTANVTKTYVGENFTYTITVVNLGPDTAVNSRVYDVLPKGVKLLSFNESKGSYNPQTGKWAIGDMALGEEVTLKVNVRALTTGKIVNEARVESDTYDNDTSNNNDSATVIVIGDKPPIKMLPTGNPILIALLSLLAIVGVTLRRKS